MGATNRNRGTNHPSGGEIWALLVLFAIPQKPVQSPDAVRDEIVGFEEVEVLKGEH